MRPPESRFTRMSLLLVMVLSTIDDLFDLQQERIPVRVIAQSAEEAADPGLLVHPFLDFRRDPGVKRPQLFQREPQRASDPCQNLRAGPPSICFDIRDEGRLNPDLGGKASDGEPQLL